VSALGSIQEALAPGKFVVVDQYINRTVARLSSFFGPGVVAHASLADPVCPRLSDLAFNAGQASGASIVLAEPMSRSWARSSRPGPKVGCSGLGGAMSSA